MLLVGWWVGQGEEGGGGGGIKRARMVIRIQ